MKNFYLKTLLLTAVLGLTALAAQAADPKNYYPLTPDSTWTYSITNHEDNDDTFDETVTIDKPEIYDKATYSILKQKDKRGIVRSFVLSNDKGIYWKKIGASKSYTPEASSVFTPEIPIMIYPLNQGSKWDWEGNLKIAWINKHIKMHCEVVSVNDEIKVPAGTFKCVKIYIHQERDKEISDEYGWYAAGIGQVKYETKKTLKVLKSYSVK